MRCKFPFAMKRIRILLADDHAVVRQGFKMILGAQADMEIVGEAGNGREAVELAEELRPDIVVMDVAMPELNGIEATRRLAASLPHTRVVALSMHKDSVYVRETLRAGARGYLLKDSPAGDLVSAVRAVASEPPWQSCGNNQTGPVYGTIPKFAENIRAKGDKNVVAQAVEC